MYESQSNLGIMRYTGHNVVKEPKTLNVVGSPVRSQVVETTPSALAKRRSVVFPSNQGVLLPRTPVAVKGNPDPNQLTPRPPSTSKPSTSNTPNRSRGVSESDGAQNVYKDTMDMLLKLQQCNTKVTSTSFAHMGNEAKPVLRTRANSSCPIRNTRRFHSMVGIYLSYICECLMKVEFGMSEGCESKQDATVTESSATETGASSTSVESTSSEIAGIRPNSNTSRHSISLGFRTATISSEEDVTSKKTRKKTADESYIAIDRTTLIQKFDCNIVVGGLNEDDAIIGIARWTVDGMYDININSGERVEGAVDDVSSNQPSMLRSASRMTGIRKKEVLSKLRKSILKTYYEASSSLSVSIKDISLEAANARNLG